MSPGRELDAIVAEKVMGTPKPEQDVYELYPAGAWLLAGQFGRDDLHPGWTVKTGTNPDDSQLIDTWFEPKHFSTDIAAAWEVVEKLTGLEWTKFDMNLPPLHVYSAEEAALEICLAALKAVE